MKIINNAKIKIMSKGNKIKTQIPKQQQIPSSNPYYANSKDRISFYLSKIQKKIIKQIDEQKQPIPQHNSPFFQTTSAKTIKLQQQQLKKLTDQKSKTQNKLKLLTDRQFQLQHKYRNNLKNKYFNKHQNIHERSMIVSRTIDMKKPPNQDSNLENQFLSLEIPSFDPQPNKSSSLNKLRPKSQLTIKDIQTLKNLKNQYKKFQEQLVNKTKKHDQQLQKIKIQNLQLQQLIKKQKNLQKRVQIQTKLQQLEKQKLQRIQKFQQEQIKLQQIKRRPKIHEKIVKQFQQKQKAINQQKLQKMKQRLKNKLIDVSQIHQHQKQYEYLRNQQLKSIQQKYLEQSRILKESKIGPEKLSKFYRSVVEEEEQIKNQKKRKQLATIQKSERIKQYAAKVYQEHYPRVKTRENDEEQQEKSQQKNDHSLSIQERKQLGNNYLRSAIKSLKEQQKTKSKMTTSESTQKETQLPRISSISTKYKDYMIEQRSRYKSDIERSQATQQKLKQKYIQSVQEVKKIMNQDLNVKDKHKTIEKIQKITERMEHEPNDRNYLDKIRAKLKILETIT